MYKAISWIILMLSACPLFGQAPKTISLESCMQAALSNSDAYLNLQAVKAIRAKEEALYRKSFLPTFGLNVSIPNLNRSISPITLPDGSDIFVERFLANSSASLSVSQLIPQTGGTLSLSSSLNRIDLLGENASSSYSMNWFILRYEQSLIGFNPLKWAKKKRKQTLLKNEIDQLKDLEDIRYNTTEIFFGVLLANIQVDLSRNNLALARKILEKGQLLFEQQRILESDLTQLELNLVEAQSQLLSDSINYDRQRSDLAIYLKWPALEQDIEIEHPEIFEKADLSYDNILDRIEKYGLTIDARMASLDMEESIERIKSQNKINAQFGISYGINSRSVAIDDIFNSPSSSQLLGTNISIPIFDWGRGKDVLEIAYLQKEMMDRQYFTQRKALQNNVLSIIQSFDQAYAGLALTERKQALSEKHLSQIKEKLLAGRILIDEYQAALLKVEGAAVSYIKALRGLWQQRYQLRKQTLYDYFSNKDLTF